MPQWIEFYWAIIVLLCAQLVLRFFKLFRLLPRRQARIMDLTLKGVGLCIGVLLLLKAPNYVSSQDQEVAVWANLSFLVCLIIALAINLWGTGRLLLSLWRERDQMLPARQHYRSGDAETDQPEMRVLIDRQAHLTNHVIRPAKTSPKLGVVRPIYVLRHS